MPHELDEQADGKDVALAIGEELTLTLRENPTTGYRWDVEKPGTPACELTSDDFVPPSGAAAGAGGHHRWRFRGAKVGHADIALTYGRFGQTGKTFTLHVTVGG